MVENKDEDEVRKTVRKRYANIVRNSSSCCGPSTNTTSSCCGPQTNTNIASSCCGPSSSNNLADRISSGIGYSEQEIESVPQGSNLGLGCGNPTAHASIKEGDVVLDLGSGAGFDVFLASQRVGKEGKVIGIDMTPEMIDKARENAIQGNYENVEFRLGEIENLPVADNTADLTISNCVINLSPNKEKVFQEIFRVLKPGGKIMISDIVLLKELPDFVKNSIDAYVGCVSGALLKEEYIRTIQNSGFQDVKIIQETTFPADFLANIPNIDSLLEKFNLTFEEIGEVAKTVVSVKVQGIKPN